MKYEYSWNQTTPSADMRRIDPEAFGEEIQRIESEHGGIVTSRLLADEARDKNHMAHDFIYHVGQKRAAQFYYDDRARKLIANLQVVVVDSGVPPVRARIAIKGAATKESGHERFVSAQEVSADGDLRAAHRKSLLRRLNLIRAELFGFDEFAEVILVITTVLDREDAA